MRERGATRPFEAALKGAREISFTIISITFSLIAVFIPVLLMGMRELDFHSRFTTMGVFKLRFFSSDTVPLSEKLIVTALLGGLGVALLLAVRKQAPVIL